MMQQPVYQSEHQGSPDPSQQMVLCPVRLVYETQMLVQPGDQIQPNQTILINPQNTPPWIQNRQVQNQVIYVQHVPTNYIPPPQQHIDQNQLYIQNYAYQNVPQMYVQNPQEHIRPLQMVPNMVPNMPTNIGALQNPRMVSSVAPMPQSVNVVNTIQTQTNATNRLVVPNQNEVINKQETIPQNIYRQIPQMMQQDPRLPIQPSITMVPNSIQTIQRAPQFEPNINQIRPVQQNIATANIQQAYPNTIFNVDESRKVNANKGNNFNIVNPVPSVKSSPQVYRPIQPRTNQVRSNVPTNTIVPMQSSSQVQQSVPNMITVSNVPRKILPNTVIPVSNNVNTTLNNVKVDGNNILFNRKRKSESLDEMQKKVSVANETENPIVIKQIQNESHTSCADVGVNTSPIHRPSGRITINNLQITPLNPLANAKIIEELAKPIRSYPPVTETQTSRNINIVPSEAVADAVPTDKEKLVRNTVYVQARGRILTDKDVPEIPKLETNIKLEPDIIAPTAAVNETQREANLENNKDSNIKKEVSTTPNIKVDKSELKQEIITNTSIKLDKEVNEVKTESKSDTKSSRLVEDSSVDDKKKLKEESSPDAKIKEDRAYILTHVLGGFVIQESNIAFPIRKPLKEKTIFSNTEESKGDSKDMKHGREFVKDNSKILDISHLNIKECENMEANDDSEHSEEKVSENPFKLLKPSDVRSWSAEELATHLAKYDWNETVSVLQEHELDGESLLLVSKGQLVTIGVKEAHAEIICDFVKG